MKRQGIFTCITIHCNTDTVINLLSCHTSGIERLGCAARHYRVNLGLGGLCYENL